MIGYSEPKVVFSLTPSGHRLALELQREPPSHNPSAPEISPQDDVRRLPDVSEQVEQSPAGAPP